MEIMLGMTVCVLMERYIVNYKGVLEEEAYKVFCPEVVEGKWLTDDRLEDGSFVVWSRSN